MNESVTPLFEWAINELSIEVGWWINRLSFSVRLNDTRSRHSLLLFMEVAALSSCLCMGKRWPPFTDDL